MLRAANVVVLIGLLSLIGGCTSSGTDASQHTSTSMSSSPPPTPITTTSASPSLETQAAVAAYEAFNRAVNAGLRDPSGDYARAIAAHSLDPARGTAESNVASFRLADIAFRGTPPQPRIKVTGSSPDAQPWPTVSLIDCPTVSGTWRAVNTKTGKAVPVTYPSGSAKPPHAITVTVINYKTGWMVKMAKTDVRHTCEP